MDINEASEIPVAYGDGARSVHTLLRITDPGTGSTAEALFDNLTTAMHLVVANGLALVEETIGSVPLDHNISPVLRGWRHYASGDDNETLILICHGDPGLLEVR